MFRWIILGVLIITVPRYAEAFRAIDPLVFGVPLPAVGMGLLMGLGTYLIVNTHQKCVEEIEAHRIYVEKHEASMARQGKQSHLPRELPYLKGFKTLEAVYVLLLVLAVVVQGAWITARLTDQSLADLLATIHAVATWAYGFALALAPELLVYGASKAIRLDRALSEHGRNASDSDSEAETLLSELVRTWLLPRRNGSESVPNRSEPSETPPARRPNASEPPARYSEFQRAVERLGIAADELADLTGPELVDRGLAGYSRIATSWKNRLLASNGHEE